VTAQIHELLQLDGESVGLACCPALPEGHPRLVARAPVIGSPLNSTACIRGYRGSWAIREGRLYLLALEGIWELAPGEPLFAEWVSGELRAVSGRELRYVHGGFASAFEHERLLTVERGVVSASRTIDHGADVPASGGDGRPSES
jgi:hypothetical protein